MSWRCGGPIVNDPVLLRILIDSIKENRKKCIGLFESSYVDLDVAWLL